VYVYMLVRMCICGCACTSGTSCVNSSYIILYYILFYSILFYSILFYSILFYSIILYSISFHKCRTVTIDMWIVSCCLPGFLTDCVFLCVRCMQGCDRYVLLVHRLYCASTYSLGTQTLSSLGYISLCYCCHSY
jgi:hypothetical protein